MEMQTPQMGPETRPPTLRLPHPPPTVSAVSRGRFEGRGAYTTLPLAQSSVYRALPALRLHSSQTSEVRDAAGTQDIGT